MRNQLRRKPSDAVASIFISSLAIFFHFVTFYSKFNAGQQERRHTHTYTQTDTDTVTDTGTHTQQVSSSGWEDQQTVKRSFF